MNNSLLILFRGLPRHVRNTRSSRPDCPYKPDSFIRDKQGEKPQMIKHADNCKRKPICTCGFIKAPIPKSNVAQTTQAKGKSTR